MKLKLLAIVLTYLKFFLQFNCHTIKIEQIELLDLNGMPLLSNFPVYFKCCLLASKQKFQILFQRQDNSSQSIGEHIEPFFFSYESVKVNVNTSIENEEFQANAALFLSEVSFNAAKNGKATEIGHEIVINIFKTVLFKSNDIKVTELYLKINLNHRSKNQQCNFN